MLTIEAIDVDCHDPERVGAFWAAALGRELKAGDGEERYLEASGANPEILFLPVPEAKVVKNRLHLDLRPDDQGAEVERLLGLGATRVQIGQTGEESWVVLADVEGNEFCILRSRAAAGTE